MMNKSTLIEVLPKPIEAGKELLSKRFTDFLRYGKNLTLVEISADIAEKAGKLRGSYPFSILMDLSLRFIVYITRLSQGHR